MMDIEKLIKHYASIKEQSIKGRTVTPEQVSCLLKRLNTGVKILGKSVMGHDIYSFSVGRGSEKVLLWTQMHGNEPTATGAVFDIFNFLNNPGPFTGFADSLLDKFQLMFIPMLNPDGALLYRRTNAMDIDLNRDARALSAPESRILRTARDNFSPHYCFNLHDQRNIYNVCGTGKTATISFLAPAEGPDRAVTMNRQRSMALIAAMNAAVQHIIPGCVGRYSDEFYPTATGDNFQKDGFVTMLIESGTYPGDPERQTARLCNFTAILAALEYVNSGCGQDEAMTGDYFSIPENGQKMLDILVKNVKIALNGIEAIVDIGVMFDEKPAPDRNSMLKRCVIESIGDLSAYFGIETLDAGGKFMRGYTEKCPQTGCEINYPVDFE